MAFRVLVLGDPRFRDFAQLRDTLDATLVNRLPEVVIVTTGGPGLPALAASYARSRGLELVPVVPDCQRFPGCAQEKRDERLIELADAVVLVGEAPDEPTRRLLSRLRAKGVRVLTVTAPTKAGPGQPEPRPPYPRLPD
jgi:hypothetical protein